jgi:hypothetical protein
MATGDSEVLLADIAQEIVVVKYKKVVLSP